MKQGGRGGIEAGQVPADMVLTLWNSQLASLLRGAQGRRESNPH
jgi:hypothetical protein